MKAGRPAPIEIENSTIAEWLAREAERAEGILARAFRRASRAAFLWPEEARELVRAGRSLTELAAIGPFISRRITQWFDAPPPTVQPPPLRKDFLTLTHARRILARSPLGEARGDLQMHTVWSDGSATVAAMAQAAQSLGYEYIAITDHAKGLKIAGGINETELRQQGVEIGKVNADLGGKFRVLRSIELNLSPNGAGDMAPDALRELDAVVGSFHSRLRLTDD